MNQSTPTASLRLENQVAVVTGGSKGIGEGIVRRFVEEGAKVVFSGRSSDKGKHRGHIKASSQQVTITPRRRIQNSALFCFGNIR